MRHSNKLIQRKDLLGNFRCNMIHTPNHIIMDGMNIIIHIPIIKTLATISNLVRTLATSSISELKTQGSSNLPCKMEEEEQMKNFTI